MRATRSTGILVAILALTLTGCSAPTLRQTPLFSDSPAVFAYYENDGSGGLEALNASNGQPMWKTHFGNMYANSYSSAVMANGVVYGIADHNFSSVGAAEHAPPAPSVIAVRASDGKLLWRGSEPQAREFPLNPAGWPLHCLVWHSCWLSFQSRPSSRSRAHSPRSVATPSVPR